MEIVPWDFSATPGPSHAQWFAWNNEHGATLRVAGGVMMMTKERLAKLAEDFERKDKFDKLLDSFDRSINFFTGMATTIEGARARLLIGNAVWVLSLEATKAGKPSDEPVPAA
jgi:hypothetical protein